MTKNKNIIGISLGTRKIGIALIVNGELVDWSVKEYKERWSKEKSDVILYALDQMLKKYTVGIFAITLKGLALKIPDAIDRHTKVVDLHRDINFLAQQYGVATETFSIKSLKIFLDVRNKREMRSRVFQLYPELQSEYECDIKKKNDYYMKLFEAVLAAHVLYLQP